MSANTDTVNRYLDGFRRNDHAQILSCLTDDIRWTVLVDPQGNEFCAFGP